MPDAELGPDNERDGKGQYEPLTEAQNKDNILSMGFTIVQQIVD